MTVLRAILVLLIPLAAAAHAVPASDAAPSHAMYSDYVPPALTDIGIDEKSGQQVPLDLQFVDETGQIVRLGKYFNQGRPVLLQLSYFGCPMLCGLVSDGMVESLNALKLEMGKDFEVINLSFDTTERPALAAQKKKSFLEAYDRPAGGEAWHFLTGQEPQINELVDAVGFRYAWDSRSRQFSHPAVLILLTPDGRVSRYLYGVKFDPRTLRLSLVEASEGTIGTTTDRFLLACFHFDPKTGQYSVAAMRIMRTGGVVTVITLAVVIGTALRRESRRRRSEQQAMNSLAQA
jgi:protein SCO1